MAQRTPLLVLKALTILALIYFLFPANFRLVWRCMQLVERKQIDKEREQIPFWVVTITATGAELLFYPEEFDAYRNKHLYYSFLIPSGQEKEVEAQIAAARESKCPTCKGYSTLHVTTIDSNHQLIEVYLHGDPHDDIFWYEASDKKLVPKYWAILGIPHAFAGLILAGVLVLCEYFALRSVARLAREMFIKPAGTTPPYAF